MTREQIVAAWRRYGVNLEQDRLGNWSWCELSEDGEQGAYSPPFATFERCIEDLEHCFGPLGAQ